MEEPASPATPLPGGKKNEPARAGTGVPAPSRGVTFVESINEAALNKRLTLPAENDFDIGTLLSMPRLYDWVECPISAREKFYMYSGGNDDGVALRFFWNGHYEKATLKAWSWFSRKAEGLIADVGAHTGAYTLSAFAAGAKNVISFEPHFMNFARLILNLRANQFPTQNCFMLAVSNSNQIRPFSISTGIEYLSTGGSIGERPRGITMPVQAIALDTFLEGAARDELRLIKLDVEGHEAQCLHGMKNLISRNRPNIFFECIDSAAGAEVQEILSRFEYHFYEVDDQSGTVRSTDRIAPAMDGAGRLVRHRLNRIATPDSRLGEEEFA